MRTLYRAYVTFIATLVLESACPSTLLLATAVVSLYNPWAVAAEDVSYPRLHVAVEQGLLTVEATDARLAQILRLIGERAGVVVRFLGDARTKVTQSFRRVPLEEGLRRLLQGHSLVLVYAPTRDGGDPALPEVLVIASPSTAAGRSRATAEPPAAGSSPDATLGLGPAGAAAPDPGPASSGGKRSVGPAPTAGPARGAAGNLASQLEAAQALARSGDERAAADLAQMLAADPNPLVRSQAAALLGNKGGELAASALVGALADDDPAVRLHAVRALGKVEGAAAVPVLENIVLRDPEPRVRQVAVRWLAALPGEKASAALRAAASDPDPAVRAEVATALAIWGKRVR